MSRIPGTTRAASRSRRHSARAGRARAIVPAALVVLALAGCGGRQHARTARVPVTVAMVASRTMPFELISSGTIEPLQTAGVGSQVGGVVQRVGFREGDEVAEGQLLFQLDPRPFRAALDQAQAALARDRSQYEVARLEADRAQKLYSQNMLSEAEWQQQRNAAEAVAATMSADSAAVASARLNLEYASIRAPIAGRTGQLMVHEGDYVKSATSDPLVTINQIHPVRVRFVVPDDAVALVQRHRSGNPRVRVRIPGADSSAIEGALVFVDNAVDPSSGTASQGRVHES
jgi:multidrug efflux system membrane fusion protein